MDEIEQAGGQVKNVSKSYRIVSYRTKSAKQRASPQLFLFVISVFLHASAKVRPRRRRMCFPALQECCFVRPSSG